MILTIHQPEHLPWLGLYNKAAKADKFVLFDSVQYEKNNYQSRNRILGTNGPQWINIPVSLTGHIRGTIATTKISLMGGNKKWKEKYLRTICDSYKKYPFFSDVYPILEEAILIDTEFFCDINIKIFVEFCKKLNICPEFIRSSTMELEGHKSNLVLNVCKSLNASVYIAGSGGRSYMNKHEFDKNHIVVKFNDYNHPIYPQKRAENFISHLSALDLFMNCGFSESKKIIMSNNEGLADW